jgi:hypothetical protein
MAVNKNFVVKNGLEVNTNLILADAATDKVGIGTTVPEYTLDVAGGIGATSVYAAGFSTFIGDVKIGSAQTTLTAIGHSVGVGTDTPSYLLDIRSAVSTGATSLYVKGDARITGKLDVAGDITYDEVTGRNLYITGLSTFVGLSSAQEVRVGAGISVVGVSTLHSNLTVAGLSTFTGAIDANGDLDVDGHTNLDNVSIAGVATATLFSGASQIGIQSAGTQIGAGITQLNFIGAGNTFAVSGTTVDISIAGGGGGGGAGAFTTSVTGIQTTSQIVGIGTTSTDDSDLQGIGNSARGMYVSNGMIIMDNLVSGNHYIGTNFNGMMVGPVNIEGTISIDGNYVVV